ncbi:hypothetical protein [Thiothrix lacustris]|uniref:hypothetical protein n=1 Tax=Thiothrix lacustris TaxID=525917 RepID=UPI0027E4337A|nr:hypothetical protein [Thiothrix lacustris]WMP15637.1 hypothetical protein RCS87_00110 [Thiothrix lacustris]
MSQDALLKLIKNGATASPWGNGIHIELDDKNLWTDHTENGIEIWTNSAGGVRSSRAIVDLNMIEVLIAELQERLKNPTPVNND